MHSNFNLRCDLKQVLLSDCDLNQRLQIGAVYFQDVTPEEMAQMRLTTKTNLAARVLMACAVNDGKTLRSVEIADACNASLNHLLLVVGALQAHGFIETIRGRNGGLRLARAPAKISIGEVFRVFEAGVPFAECFSPDTNTCPLTASCRLRNFVSRAVEAFYHELDMVTLADLTKGNCGLNELLLVRDHLGGGCTKVASN